MDDSNVSSIQSVFVFPSQYLSICLLYTSGGFHSANISLNYPDMFDYVGLFSAALNVQSAGQKNSPVYQDMAKKLAVQFDKAPKLYWLGIGKDDFLYRNNAAYREMCIRDRMSLMNR